MAGILYIDARELYNNIEKLAPVTSAAIQEDVALLYNRHTDMELKQFPQWWGRGQQYISLIRKNS